MSVEFPRAHFFYSTNCRVEYSPWLGDDGALVAHSEKNGYSSHSSKAAEILHLVSEALFIPLRCSFQLSALVIEPLAGKNKEHALWGITSRIVCLLLVLAVIPSAIFFTPLALILRCIDHAFRPIINIVDNGNSTTTSAKPALLKDEPLHIRTHNLGLMPAFISTLSNLRPPEIRAKEIVTDLLLDKQSPDMVFFQDVYHEDATEILCNGLKEKYPYIIHQVVPNILGLGSGNLVLSKYLPKYVEFERFQHMLGTEKFTPKGILKVCIETTEAHLFFYSVHLQKDLGNDNAQARFAQLEQMNALLQQDAERFPDVKQIVLGDFNCSQLTLWGENNENQAERIVLDKFDTLFNDPYLKDHEKLTGQRRKGNSDYLDQDVEHMKVKVNSLTEPSGTYYHGPNAERRIFHRLTAGLDRYWNGYPEFGGKVVEEKKVSWGTAKWAMEQTANTARLDYIVLPKHQQGLKGKVEIRRTLIDQQAPSASSAHLPVDGKFWIPVS